MKIFLIDTFPEDMRQALEAMGQPMEYAPDLSRAEILERLSDVEVLVMNSRTHVDAELLDHAPQLKMLCRAGVGMDHFDLDELKRRGVRVVNTPGANAIPVGEQSVGMLLCLMHNIARADQQVRRFQWLREENRGTELRGKTVGVIGYGATGSAVGRNLSGFGCRILAYDKYKSGYAPEFTTETTLDHIRREADILTLHVPLTEETRAWINAEFLAGFDKPIWLLNLARGPILPLKSLIEALEAGHVIAAGLDVLENEKMDRLSPEERQRLQHLFTDGRVLFTPHIGGWSHESLHRINFTLVDAIRDFAAES